MESKQKRKISNIIMVALIAVIAVSGIMAVGNIKGWFSKSVSSSSIVASEVSGIVNIERKGVGYTLKNDTVLQKVDIIETKGNSFCEFTIDDKNKGMMDENSELVINDYASDNLSVTANFGNTLFDFSKGGNISLIFEEENNVSSKDSVFSVSSQVGSFNLYVYDGSLDAKLSTGETYSIEKGKMLSVVDDKKGSITATESDMKANSLNDFMLEKIIAIDNKNLCFSKKECEEVLTAREAEKQSIDTDQIIAAFDTKDSKSSDSQEGNSESGENKTSDNSKSDTSSGNNQSDKKDNNSKSTNKCTITIRCDTILNNMGNLAPGKEAYVPANGCILAVSTVEFKEGETVFDVLKRACNAANIHLEYAYTPGYGSYYIEGINQLYEFDCGNESGWTYKVNGWFPNYGCSSYKLKNGDNIVWCYTCNGLGADVGGSVY